MKAEREFGLFDRHIPALDGLRAFSILWVVFHHLPLRAGLLWSGLEFVRHRGELGVEIFFAISGFLVTRSLEQCWRSTATTAEATKEFFMRRLARIWPPYYIALGIFGCAVLLSGSLTGPSGSGIMWSVPTFLANYTMPSLSGPVEAGNALTRSFSILWSLCFEEQFYLVMAVVFLFSGRNYAKWMLVLAVLSICSRFLFVFSSVPSNYQQIHMMTHFRWDAIAWGCLAWAKRDRVGPWIAKSRWLWFAVIPMMAVTLGYFRHSEPITPFQASVAFGFSAVTFTLLVMLVCYARSPWTRILETRPLMKLGQCSYEVYLIHGLIIWILTRQSEIQSVWSAVMTMAVSILAGWVFYQFVGSPLRRKVLELYGSTKLRSIELRSGQA